MRVAGEVAVRAGAGQVRAALRDPAVLARAIPGCERFEVVTPGSAEFTVTTAITAVAGSYSGRIRHAGGSDSGHLTEKLEGSGDRGTFEAELSCRLGPAPDGTLISYEANVVVGGPLAGAGSLLLASVANRLAGEFFANIEAEAARSEKSPRRARLAPPPMEDDPARLVVRLARRTDVRIAFSAGLLIGIAVVIAGVVFGRRKPRGGR
jgi:carbon monoxide dehydrogenase subunit G